MNRRIALLVVALCALLSPGRAGAGAIGAQMRYASFSNGNDLRDPIIYYAPGPFHVQLEYWDFVRGEDQFRPEVGVHLRDRRRSSYTLQWRHERTAERFWLGTEQVLDKHFVARADVSPIVADDETDVVVSAGLDGYWGSYSFAGVTVVRDPRGDDLWVVPMRVRCANERNDWLQLTLAPASRRSFGWAADAKVSFVRLGVERNSRYDFTDIDNTFYTIGVEFPMPKR